MTQEELLNINKGDVITAVFNGISRDFVVTSIDGDGFDMEPTPRVHVRINYLEIKEGLNLEALTLKKKARK